MPPLFTGVGVALVTLFDDAGRLDTAATADLAVQLTGLGMRSVLVAGTTGEAMALSVEERSTLIEAVRAAVPAGVPVIAGTGAPTGAQAAHLTERAYDAGGESTSAYFDRVATAGNGRPLLAYHFPFASAPGIPVELLPDLPVSGLKDSSGDAGRLLDELEIFGGDIYVGATTVLTMGGAVGATGAILVLANAEPERCIAAFNGDGKAQVELAAPHRASMVGFPAGIKQLVADRFGVSAVARVGQ
jgi:4-hydroxy-tetrahydrodipicolinate synthase